MLSRRAAVVIAVMDAVTAGLVAFGVFVALPARWWPVDAAAAVVIALEGGAAAGLSLRARWGEAVARASALVVTLVGLGAVTALALTASWLHGVYGPVGRGASIVLTLVAALALPYLVVLPAAQLYWLRPARKGLARVESEGEGEGVREAPRVVAVADGRAGGRP